MRRGDSERWGFDDEDLGDPSAVFLELAFVAVFFTGLVTIFLYLLSNLPQ